MKYALGAELEAVEPKIVKLATEWEKAAAEVESLADQSNAR